MSHATTGSSALTRAAWTATLASGFALAAAYGYFEIHLGLVACTLCWWQRYAMFAAFGAGLAALAALGVAGRRRREPSLDAPPSERRPGRAALLRVAPFALTGSAAFAFFVSAVLALWHVLTEMGVIPVVVCTAPPLDLSGEPGTAFAALLEKPPVRCDRVPWSFMGLSIAGWNLVYSLFFSLVLAGLLRRHFLRRGFRPTGSE